MIALRADARGVRRIVREGDGATTAFVDADWVADGHDGAIRSVEDVDPALAAGRLLAAADRFADLVAGAPSGSVEVSGDGLIARATRVALESRHGPADSPAGWIDLTGDPAQVLAATEQVRDLGVVVLAGEPRGRQLAIDLYVDVHRRGLRLLGAPPPDADAPVQDDARIRWALDQLVELSPGEPVPGDASWFAVAAG